MLSPSPGHAAPPLRALGTGDKLADRRVGEAGVEVTLCATADSLTTARLRAVVIPDLARKIRHWIKVWESLHLATLFEEAGDYDLIHNHYDFLPLTYSGLVPPVVTTIHGFSSPKILPVYKNTIGE